MPGSCHRKREKAERREQLKREGKLLTGKAKEEAERRARAAEQFLKQAGINPDERECPPLLLLPPPPTTIVGGLGGGHNRICTGV